MTKTIKRLLKDAAVKVSRRLDRYSGYEPPARVVERVVEKPVERVVYVERPPEPSIDHPTTHTQARGTR